MPGNEDARYGLLWLPALGVGARYYEKFGHELRACGIALETLEWRGTGTHPLRAGRRVDWGYRELLLDAAHALGRAQRANPNRVWLLGGHSMGGQLAALLAAIVGTGEFVAARPVDGLVLVATGVPHWRLYQGRMRWGVRAFAALLPAITAMVGHFPGTALRFAGREARGVMRDWAHSALTGRYAARGVALDLDRALQTLRVPVCAVALAQDWLAPVASLQALLAKLPDSSVSQKILGRDELEVRGDHFAWLKQPAAIVETIAAWTARVHAERTTEAGSGAPEHS